MYEGGNNKAVKNMYGDREKRQGKSSTWAEKIKKRIIKRTEKRMRKKERVSCARKKKKKRRWKKETRVILMGVKCAMWYE